LKVDRQFIGEKEKTEHFLIPQGTIENLWVSVSVLGEGRGEVNLGSFRSGTI